MNVGFRISGQFQCISGFIQNYGCSGTSGLDPSIVCDTFMESLSRGEIKNTDVKKVTTKEIYMSRMYSLLSPPKVELKFLLTNFSELVYRRTRERAGVSNIL